MKFIIATAALLGTITGLLVGIYAASRVVMVVARDWLLPNFLGAINARTQTPAAATGTVGLIVCESGLGLRSALRGAASGAGPGAAGARNLTWPGANPAGTGTPIPQPGTCSRPGRGPCPAPGMP